MPLPGSTNLASAALVAVRLRTHAAWLRCAAGRVSMKASHRPSWESSASAVLQAAHTGPLRQKRSNVASGFCRGNSHAPHALAGTEISSPWLCASSRACSAKYGSTVSPPCCTVIAPEASEYPARSSVAAGAPNDAPIAAQVMALRTSRCRHCRGRHRLRRDRGGECGFNGRSVAWADMFSAIAPHGLCAGEHMLKVFASAQTTPAARNYVSASPWSPAKQMEMANLAYQGTPHENAKDVWNRRGARPGRHGAHDAPDHHALGACLRPAAAPHAHRPQSPARGRRGHRYAGVGADVRGGATGGFLGGGRGHRDVRRAAHPGRGLPDAPARLPGRGGGECIAQPL